MPFLVDENLSPVVAEALRSDGHDARAISRSPDQGQPDESIWAIAAAEDRIVVTRDLDFPLALLPKPPGLLLVRVPTSYRRSQIANLIATSVRDCLDLLLGNVTVMAPGREPRRREL
jgi:predicted nuclease of predicted toxin-antitoxin system